MRKALVLSFLSLFLLFSAEAMAERAFEATLVGFVTYVRDGASLEVSSIPVKLQGTVVPALEQPAGQAARDALEAATHQELVFCRLTGEINEERYLGRCFLARQLGERGLTVGEIISALFLAVAGETYEREKLEKIHANAVEAFREGDLAFIQISSGLARDCPRASRGRYLEYETQEAKTAIDLPPDCVP